jgi:hypothetical protein
MLRGDVYVLECAYTFYTDSAPAEGSSVQSNADAPVALFGETPPGIQSQSIF